ncbi:MAG: hypothetical protein JWO71_2487 [Candidatus Acidoferrum typicum]|nr:hypothetical protein [Candidatus Acidoferrum typicum]
MWVSVGAAARAGVPDDMLKYFAGDVCLNTSRALPINEITQVDQLAGGLMLIESKVFTALADRYPERKYTLYDGELESKFNRGRTFAYEFYRRICGPT